MDTNSLKELMNAVPISTERPKGPVPDFEPGWCKELLGSEFYAVATGGIRVQTAVKTKQTPKT